uniref:Uncharacterized protein n=1 Tax=Mesocestoides corti TaxID=53468 RepID=A0A5K3FMF0_MESCO
MAGGCHDEITMSDTEVQNTVEMLNQLNSMRSKQSNEEAHLCCLRFFQILCLHLNHIHFSRFISMDF